jgi:DNA-damage-inducible protein J
MKTAIIHARIEPQTKRSAEGVLHKLGLSPTEAIRMFYRQITLRGGLPFAVVIPNALTASTLEKSRHGKEIETFDTLDEMAASWKK